MKEKRISIEIVNISRIAGDRAHESNKFCAAMGRKRDIVERSK